MPLYWDGTPLGELSDCLLDAHIEYRPSNQAEHRNQPVYDRNTDLHQHGWKSFPGKQSPQGTQSLLVIGQLKEDGEVMIYQVPSGPGTYFRGE